MSSGMIERLRGKRDAPAVFKSKLAALRAHRLDALVLVFEGPEDKTVYYHWIKQAAPLLSYEVIVCNGKGNVLAFRELLGRDLSEMKKDVYFFVDHDFDGLRGHASGSDIHVTETYSIENYVVCEQVLEDVLTVELHCEGEPAVRAAVLAKFQSLYAEFLSVTKPLNRRIFLAKKASIRNLKPWPNKISSLAKVTLDCIAPSDDSLANVVALEREPTQEEFEKFKVEFDALLPHAHYRGKFALAFFMRLIELLCIDRSCTKPVAFAPLQGKNSGGRLGLDAVAGKSIAPLSFRNFIQHIVGTLQSPPIGIPAQ